MLLIANPIFDTAFKYLLDDKPSAKTLIAAILNIEIADLELQSTEIPLSFPGVLMPTDFTINVMRLDFKATLKLKDGEEKVVLIEVQKAKVLSDIGRFRRYLASQYNDSKNLRETASKEIVGLPIISIYFLGYNLGPFMNSPIINVMRTCIDNYSQEELPESDPFIESLTHDCVVVQVPLLKKFRRNKLEKLLSIFSSLDKTSQEFDHDDFPVEYRHILNRLSEMMIDEVLKESLISEKEYVEQYFKKLEASEKALSEAIEEASKERRQKEEERRQKEEERRQKEEERKQKEQAKSINRIMISKMQSLGMSLEEIAKEINLTIEELKELLR